MNFVVVLVLVAANMNPSLEIRYRRHLRALPTFAPHLTLAEKVWPLLEKHPLSVLQHEVVYTAAATGPLTSASTSATAMSAPCVASVPTTEGSAGENCLATTRASLIQAWSERRPELRPFLYGLLDFFAADAPTSELIFGLRRSLATPPIHFLRAEATREAVWRANMERLVQWERRTVRLTIVQIKGQNRAQRLRSLVQILRSEETFDEAVTMRTDSLDVTFADVTTAEEQFVRLARILSLAVDRRCHNEVIRLAFVYGKDPRDVTNVYRTIPVDPCRLLVLGHHSELIPRLFPMAAVTQPITDLPMTVLTYKQRKLAEADFARYPLLLAKRKKTHFVVAFALNNHASIAKTVFPTKSLINDPISGAEQLATSGHQLKRLAAQMEQGRDGKVTRWSLPSSLVWCEPRSNPDASTHSSGHGYYFTASFKGPGSSAAVQTSMTFKLIKVEVPQDDEKSVPSDLHTLCAYVKRKILHLHTDPRVTDGVAKYCLAVLDTMTCFCKVNVSCLVGGWLQYARLGQRAFLAPQAPRRRIGSKSFTSPRIALSFDHGSGGQPQGSGGPDSGISLVRQCQKMRSTRKPLGKIQEKLRNTLLPSN